MASLYRKVTLFISIVIICYISSYVLVVDAQIDNTGIQLITTDAVEWPSTMSLYGNELIEDNEINGLLDGRRSLLWRTMRHYYISYGCLSANRIPCPPRSGRSYYTHNCYRAKEPVNPYTRGCSAITRCRR